MNRWAKYDSVGWFRCLFRWCEFDDNKLVEAAGFIGSAKERTKRKQWEFKNGTKEWHSENNSASKTNRKNINEETGLDIDSLLFSENPLHLEMRLLRERDVRYVGMRE